MMTVNQGLQELKRIYSEAYENDLVVRNGFDAMAEIFVKPCIEAVRSGDPEKIREAKGRLASLFGIIGTTYNPEFPNER